MSKVVRQLTLTAALIIVSAVCGLTSAHATYVTWNFALPTGTINSNNSCGSTSYCQKYLSGTYDIKANAYYNSGITNTTVSTYTSHSTWTSEKLYGKNLAGDEKGLGIASDPTGNGEIYGTHFIQIYVGDALAQGLSTFLFSMASTTQNEAWSVYGANATGNGTKLTLLVTGHDETSHTLTSGYKYYDFFYNSSLGTASGQGNNVLLQTFSAVLNTPLPTALPLLTSGLGVMGLLAWRRKSKKAAEISAI